MIRRPVDKTCFPLTFISMKTLLKLLCVAVLVSFATVQTHAACGDGSCDGKDKKDKTDQSDKK
jgi:hypothetical protein